MSNNESIKKPYVQPAIVRELDLEVRAGSPIPPTPVILPFPVDDDNQ